MTSTDNAWLEAVLDDFDTFLIDHAANERKASAAALSLVAHYPDKPELVAALVDLAIEELVHFRQVTQLLHERGLRLDHDTRDPYVNNLRQHVRKGTNLYFLDRLLMAAVVESRGHSRFRLLANAITLGDALQAFYARIADSEARHTNVFVDLAARYFEATIVQERLAEWRVIEAEVIRLLPARACLH